MLTRLPAVYLRWILTLDAPQVKRGAIDRTNLPKPAFGSSPNLQVSVPKMLPNHPIPNSLGNTHRP